MLKKVDDGIAVDQNKASFLIAELWQLLFEDREFFLKGHIRSPHVAGVGEAERPSHGNNLNTGPPDGGLRTTIILPIGDDESTRQRVPRPPSMGSGTFPASPAVSRLV